MLCDHFEWVYGPPELNDWTGEYEDRVYERSTYEDISRGRFRCTQCGHIGYYTGLWKKYYEEGIPCPGSEGVKRET